MGWWGPNIFTPGFSRKATAQQGQLLEATRLQSSLHHLKVGVKQRGLGLSFRLPMAHAQSSRAFLLPQMRAHPANSSSSRARGCPRPYRQREGELSSQTESHSLFLSPEDPSIAYFELLPWARCGNTGTNTLLTASVFEESGRQSWSTGPHSEPRAHHLLRPRPGRDIQDCPPPLCGFQSPSGSSPHSRKERCRLAACLGGCRLC